HHRRLDPAHVPLRCEKIAKTKSAGLTLVIDLFKNVGYVLIAAALPGVRSMHRSSDTPSRAADTARAHPAARFGWRARIPSDEAGGRRSRGTKGLWRLPGSRGERDPVCSSTRQNP